eukprot:3416218-Prymnesium_polylepis.1
MATLLAAATGWSPAARQWPLRAAALGLHAGRHAALAESRGGRVAGRVESGSTSKGMAEVALVELGSGCCHYDDSTKAAVRACNDAVEWNSVKVRTIIPGGYDAMKLHVQIGVPAPETVDLEQIRACFPYGQPPVVSVGEGGLRASSRAGLPADEPTEALMTVAVACVTVGFGEVDGDDSVEPEESAA